MPRVIPSGGSDQTAFFMARNAAADDALTRLYLTLLARKEDRERNEALQRELLGTRHGNRMQELEYIYGPRGPANGPTAHPFGSPGAQGDPLAKPATPQAAPQAPLPPRPGDPPVGGFLPGAGAAPSTNAFTPTSGSVSNPSPVGPQTSADDQLPPNARMAAGVLPAGGVSEFSAQSKPVPLPGQRKANAQEPGTMKYQYPQKRPTRGPAEFQEMHPYWVQKMDEAEDKYKIPKGTLLALYGYENAGGAMLGRNGAGSAEGIFQFTKQLRDQYGISDQDIMNPAVMIEAAAKNLRHNANAYKQLSGQDLPNDPRAVPYWIALHQWGATDGSRLVHAHRSESGHMPAADVMLKTPKRDNYSTLVNNGIPGHARVDDVLSRIMEKALPWFDSGIKLRTAMGQGDAGAAPRPPADVPNTGGSTGSNVPFPNSGTTTQNGRTIAPPDHPSINGVNPRLVAAVRGGAAMALPPGYAVRATSGHRPGDTGSHHAKGNASDWQIYKPNGEPIPHTGDDTTGLYTRMARGVKAWVLENDPALADRIGYGGAFDKSRGSLTGVPDLMHYDLGGANRGNLRPDVMFSRLQPLAQNERNAPIPGQQQQAQQPQRVASTQPQAYPPLKPSEAFSPLRKQQPAGVVDPATQFGVKPVGTIGQGTTFGDIQHTTPRRRFNEAPQVATPPEVAPATATPAPPTNVLPPGWKYGTLANGAPFFKLPDGSVQLAPKGYKPPSSTPTEPPPVAMPQGAGSLAIASQGRNAERMAEQMAPAIPIPRPRPSELEPRYIYKPYIGGAPIPQPRPPEAPMRGDVPIPQPRPIEADAGVPVPMYNTGVGDKVPFQSPGEMPQGKLPKGQFPDDPSWFSITPRGHVPEPDVVPTPAPPPPNVAQQAPTPTPQPLSLGRDVVPPADLPDASSQQAGSVEPYDPNADPLPLPELPPIQQADVRPEDAELYTGPASIAAPTPMRDANDASAGVTGIQPFAMPAPNVNGSTQGWKPYAAQTPTLPNVATTENRLNLSLVPDASGNADGIEIPEVIRQLMPNRMPNRADIPSLNQTNEWIQSAGRALLNPSQSDRQKQFDTAMQEWVKSRITGPASGAVTNAVDELKRSYNSGGPSGWDLTKKQFLDWYYGPNKVKTETIGMPKSSAPTTLSKPNNPMATGIPLPKQPPLVLIPNKGTNTPAFSGPVVGAPDSGGAKVMPGGGVVAPPIGTGGSAKPPGVPKVADPSSPTGYKYLTPEEAAQLPPVVEEQPVE